MLLIGHVGDNCGGVCKVKGVDMSLEMYRYLLCVVCFVCCDKDV